MEEYSDLYIYILYIYNYIYEKHSLYTAMTHQRLLDYITQPPLIAGIVRLQIWMKMTHRKSSIIKILMILSLTDEFHPFCDENGP